jgi:hypothetical protein
VGKSSGMLINLCNNQLQFLFIFHRSSYDPRTRKLAGVNWPGNVCPEGHKCFECAFFHKRYCDNCTELIAVGTSGERCTLCQFDLCSDCVFPPKNWHALENPEEYEAPEIESEIATTAPPLSSILSHIPTQPAAASPLASGAPSLPCMEVDPLPRQNRMKLRKGTPTHTANVPLTRTTTSNVSPLSPRNVATSSKALEKEPVINAGIEKDMEAATKPQRASAAYELIEISSQSSQEDAVASSPSLACRTALDISGAPTPFLVLVARTVSPIEEWGLWGF